MMQKGFFPAEWKQMPLLLMKWNLSPKFWLHFRKPLRTTGIPPSSSRIHETNSKRKQGQRSEREWARRQPWSHDISSTEKPTGSTRDAVSVPERLPSSILLPQETNTCFPTAWQHRHQPGVQVRAALSTSQVSHSFSFREQILWLFWFTGSTSAQSKERPTQAGPSWIPGTVAGRGQPHPHNLTSLVSGSGSHLACLHV